MSEQTALTNKYELDQVVDLVKNSVNSEHTRRAYERAITDFLEWWTMSDRPPLIKATVNKYKTDVLEASDYSPATINLHLSAIRKLASEAADNGLLDQVQANGIARISGVETHGKSTGNWLTQEQAQELLDTPDLSTLKGLRDRAILSVLLGCGLRRSEVAALTFAHIVQRDGRWVINDLVGKKRRKRTVPMPSFTKAAIDKWTEAADISDGFVFRPMNKAGKLTGDLVTTQLIYRVVEEHTKVLDLKEKIAAHDLRRSFAKISKANGADIVQIQKTLGHGSIKVTEDYIGEDQDLANAPCDVLGLRLNNGH